MRPVLDAILDANRDRKPSLVRRKLRLMSEDVFTFFRGTAHLFSDAWPDVRPPEPGPSIWICGDLHLENFGAYRADDGDYLFGINDFDEAIVAPCGYDLVRAAASLLIASEEWGLTPLTATGMVLAFLDHYRAAVIDPAAVAPNAERSPQTLHGPIRALLGATALGSQAALLEAHTRLGRDGSRRIRHLKGKHPAIRPERADAVREAIETLGRSRGVGEADTVLDVTARVAGVGSLGVKRYTALIRGDGKPDGARLLDVKEARASTGDPHAEAPQPESWGNEAERVVLAQRRIQEKPAAGLDTVTISGRPFRVREMIPDENRSDLARLRRRPARLRSAIKVLGGLTARAQLRAARLPSEDRRPALVGWASGSTLDAVLASAVRSAARTRRQFREYRRDLRARGDHS